METGKIQFMWLDLEPLALPKADDPTPVTAASGSVEILPDPPPPPDDSQAAPFPPQNGAESYAQLVAFCEIRGASAALSPLTHLPSYLIGNLQDPQQEQRPERVLAAFLDQHAGMIAGLQPQQLRLRYDQQAAWPDGTHQVHFAQTNAHQVPIYGSRVSGSMDADGRLTLVLNNLYPAHPQQIDGLAWGDQKQLLASAYYPEWQLAEDSPLQSLVPPLRVARPSSSEAAEGESAKKYIFPYAAEAGQGLYRPAWEVLMVDVEGNRWMTMVDAETGRLLGILPTDEFAVIQAAVFRSAQAAILGTNQVTIENLDLGATGVSLASAENVAMEGARFVDLPPAAGVVPDPLSATVYFHVRAAQQSFATSLQNVAILASAAGASPLARTRVELSNISGAARYNWVEKKIIFTRGDPSTVKPIRETGYDAEVIHHEFTHAVARYLNTNLFVYTMIPTSLAEQQQNRTSGLNEGLAYYFGCSMASDDAVFGNYAYPNPPWNNFTLTDAAGSVSFATNNNTGLMDVSHLLGIWWARVLKKVEVSLGGPARVNQIALKALVGLAGPISTEQTFAIALYHAAATCQEKNAFRASFASVNILLSFQCT